MDNAELMHHGIKGMKWGIRRYQNKDGSLTNAGKNRYSEDNQSNIVERHKAKLVDTYKSRGYSQEAAETAAKNQMKVELLVGATATVAVGVIATKAARRIGQDYVDKTIKSGTTIQNIGPYKDSTFKEYPFFAAINSHDKNAYGNLYPAEKRGMMIRDNKVANPEIFNNKIKITSDVKVASVSNARKIFEDQMKSDPSFSKEVISALKETAYGEQGKRVIAEYEKTGKVSKKLYDRFNQALATPQFQEAGIHNKFYSNMKSKGYNAILDINDTRYSGYKNISKSPTIFFGDDKWEKIASTKISDVDIDKNAAKYATKTAVKGVVKCYGGLGLGAAVGVTVSDRAAVANYLNEHPNSKLSDKEILDLIRSS